MMIPTSSPSRDSALSKLRSSCAKAVSALGRLLGGAAKKTDTK